MKRKLNNCLATLSTRQIPTTQALSKLYGGVPIGDNDDLNESGTVTIPIKEPIDGTTDNGTNNRQRDGKKK
ncbi:MAG: hypothetical protein AAFO69_17925 [Bacteroidota bacterium]